VTKPSNTLESAVRHHRAGEFEQAEKLYRQVLKSQPKNPDALHLLGVMAHQAGRHDKAVEYIRRAIKSRPRAAFHSNLGLAYHALGKLDRAVDSYRRALALKPDYIDALDNLAEALKNNGQTSEAEEYLERALRTRPSRRRRVLSATLLPVIYRSADEVSRYRRRLIEGLGALIEDGVRFDPASDSIPPLFFLAYQGMNDRPIQELITQLHADWKGEAETPQPNGPARAAGKIRVGFLSRHFRNHTIGKLTRGLVAQLSREEFSVIVLSLGEHHDADARWIQRRADEYLVVPESLKTARQTVLDAGLDLLVYPDLGMDARTSALARARLAPVQCAMWGHPVTTGIPTIDYFISSKLLELPGAQDHYTERLVELDNLPTYYYRPELPRGGKTRANFGLDDGRHLYFCPQNLFKFHPQFDLPMGEILRRDPDGELILIQGLFSHWNRLLWDRLQAAIPDVVDRVRFVPRQEREDFVCLLSL
jgi:predicted O-linked N-acetylglucosamine transferase (SPINDLY family)